MFVDTHCHIHEKEYTDSDDAYSRALAGGIDKIICVGTTNQTSELAIEFAEGHENAWASIGAHPHDAREGYENVEKLARRGSDKLVAVGEIGLDYFYQHSPPRLQHEALEAQLQIASNYGLPVIFHVRDAFDDFWPIIGNFPKINGVLHSYTDTLQTLEKALSKDFFIGVNGISTFARDKQDMWDAVPLEKMLLETDAPFLTPVPYRGKVNEPAFVKHVAEYHAERRGINLEQLARATSANANQLFRFTE